MVVVTGPRLDPEGVLAPDRARGAHLSCPISTGSSPPVTSRVVQGGLTTTMELTAAGTPFIYVPLRHHFEQNFHVRHRLDQYGAGPCLEYDAITPDTLARAITAGANDRNRRSSRAGYGSALPP